MADVCVQCKTRRKKQYWNAFPDDKHRFFKVMVQNFRQFLRIPPKFISEFKGKLSKKVTLLGPSGNKWTTTIEKRGEDFLLQNGWPKFVEDHGLNHGDFLVFKYVKDSSFKVQIFDNSACEKEDSYFVEPDAERCCSSRNNIRPENSTTSEEEESDVKQTKERRQKSVVPKHQLKHQSKKRKKEKELMQEATDEEEEETDSEEGESDVKQTKERRQKSAVSKHQLKHQSKKRKNEKELMQEAKDGEEEKTDSNSDSDKEFQRKTSGSKTRVLKNDGNHKYSMYYESNRRTITKSDKEKAFHLASKHSTNRPSCKIKMKPSHVHHLFILTIPKEFADNCLPAKSQEIMLQIGSKTWPVSLCRRNMQCTLNKGWAQFVLENNLEIEDICVLVLAKSGTKKQPTTLDVHIFRAVEEIVPLKVVKPLKSH